MSGDTSLQRDIGIRLAGQVVREHLGCRWEGISLENDDGIDGIILVRRNGRETGCILFAQVKCGVGYRRQSPRMPDHIGVSLGTEYIRVHRPRWDVKPGPVILIYIDPTTDRFLPDAWWTDLKDEASYLDKVPSYIFVPKRQRFFLHSKGHLEDLCKHSVRDAQLPEITINPTDEAVFSGYSKPLKQSARSFYQTWASLGSVNPGLGHVNVSRIGWRHLTRRGRPLSRVAQSWQLLPAARRIVEEITPAQTLSRADTVTLNGSIERVRDFLGLRARVAFPHRDPATVQVVLLRIRDIDTETGHTAQRVWFYSVYEKRRGEH